MSNQVVAALERAGKQIVHALGEGASKAEHRLLHETADNLETAAKKHVEHDARAAKDLETAARRHGDEHVTEPTSPPATTRRPTEESPGRSAIPTVNKEVNVTGKDAPGVRTRFPKNGYDLEPHTKYTVDGRGTFYTDEHGNITRVETNTGADHVNPELVKPHPNATYVVNGEHVYRTDGRGRTTYAEAGRLELKKGVRSESIQRRIGQLGEKEHGKEYDGGHLLGTQFGGSREDINLVSQLRSVNQAGPGSVYELEQSWRDMLKENPPPHIRVEVHPHYPGGSKVPDRVTVYYSINGVMQEPEVFKNV